MKQKKRESYSERWHSFKSKYAYKIPPIWVDRTGFFVFCIVFIVQ